MLFGYLGSSSESRQPRSFDRNGSDSRSSSASTTKSELERRLSKEDLRLQIAEKKKTRRKVELQTARAEKDIVDLKQKSRHTQERRSFEANEERLNATMDLQELKAEVAENARDIAEEGKGFVGKLVSSAWRKIW